MKIKHIYWFAYYNQDSPSVRYRCKMPLAWLKDKKGIQSDIVYPGYRLQEIFKFISVYFSALFFRKNDSVIIIQKVHTNKIYGRLLKLLIRVSGKNTVYDIDDADYLKYKPHVIHYFMQRCEICFGGSQAILNYIQQFNSKNYLLTSPVKKATPIKTKKNDLFHIGWIGFYNAHRESLFQYLFPAVIRLDFPVRLVLLGVTKETHYEEIARYFKTYPHIQIDVPLNLNWQDDIHIQYRIAAFDVGVAPLIDTEINSAKSAFKMKQYLSCGVPVLASPVGENISFLNNGSNGFICRDENDFTIYLNKIREMHPAEYAGMCENAYRSSKQFNLEMYCKTFQENLEAI